MRFEYKAWGAEVSEADFLVDLRRVARLLGKQSLSRMQYARHGRYKAGACKRFGGWTAAIRKAGLKPALQEPTAEQVLEDIRLAGRVLNTTVLSQSQYQQVGTYGAWSALHHFGSWTQAVAAAGLTTSTKNKLKSRDELFENLERVWMAVGRAPTRAEMVRPLSRLSRVPYIRHFGGWQNALLAFVEFTKARNAPAEIELVEPVAMHKTRREVGAWLRYEILRRDHFRCRACGRSPANDPAVELQVDHIKPWSRGGETVRESSDALPDV